MSSAASHPADALTHQIIGLAMRVHTHLGPGLLENAYENCLCHELGQHEIPFARQVELPIIYQHLQLRCGYRADIVVADTVILEIKSVERILPVHEAQLLTYLRISKLPIGLLLNFNTLSLRNGIRRRVM